MLAAMERHTTRSTLSEESFGAYMWSDFVMSQSLGGTMHNSEDVNFLRLLDELVITCFVQGAVTQLGEDSAYQKCPLQ